jgi:hypothetical protein
MRITPDLHAMVNTGTEGWRSPFRAAESRPLPTKKQSVNKNSILAEAALD